MASGGMGGGSVGEEEPLETSRAEKGVWLMKVPGFVSEAWKESVSSSSSGGNGSGSAGGSSGGVAGAVVGKVMMTIDLLRPAGAERGGPQFSMTLPGLGDSLPVDFVLNKAPDHVPMHIFSETSQGKVTLEGRIDQRFDLRPRDTFDKGYRHLLKDREKKFNTPKRTLKVLDSSKDASALGISLPGASIITSKGKRQLAAPPSKKAVEPKRFRMAKEDLEQRLFKLFEDKERWNMRQLADITLQPTQFLKEVLNELCVYNKKGQHQGMYELKAEWRSSKKTEQTGEEDTKPSV